MAVPSIFPIAISGLKANSARVAATAVNVVNLETADYQALDVRTVSLRTSPSPAGGAGVQAQLIAGRRSDLRLEFARMIEAERAYQANAAVLRRAEDLHHAALSITV